MKKIILILALTIYSFANAQIVNVPDPIFKADLLNADTSGFNNNAKDINGNWMIIDTNGDNQIQVSEALNVYYLDVGGHSGFNPGDTLYSMVGIEAFTNLTYLNCYNGKIAALDVSNNLNLVTLYCHNNKLTSIDVSMLTFLEDLRCSGNSGITGLDLSNNTALKTLFTGGIIVTGNFYQEIANMTSLNLTNNVNLRDLRIISTNLTTIDTSHNLELRTFSISYNALLEEIDASHLTYLYDFSCHNNSALTYINLKNGRNDWMDNSPDNWDYINLPNLQNVCVDALNTSLTAKINTNVGHPVTFSETCFSSPQSNLVLGSTKIDFDGNGCSISDPAFSNILVTATNGTDVYGTLTQNDGSYAIHVGQGNYTISVPNMPSYYSISPNSQTHNFTGSLEELNADFCINQTQTADDLNVTIFPVEQARPGYNATYNVVYKNMGTSPIASGSVTVAYDNTRVNFLHLLPSGSPSSQTANTFTINFSNLGVFESQIFAFEVNVLPPPANGSDDIITYTATVNPVAGDFSPADNVTVLNQIVVNSFDPNDITCIEGDRISEDDIGNYLHYVIRFQNKGTASALNIVVENELDAKLDWDTFELVMTSHPSVVHIENGNDLSFVFDNIHLPAELYDEPGSHGFIAYKIKPKSNVVLGDIFYNTAHIFFDFNEAIITNTATTEIVNIDTEPPVVSCQNITVQLDNVGNAFFSASDIDNGSTDDVAIATVEVSDDYFSCNNIGDNTVTLTVTDTSGNSSTCDAIVTIEDNFAPTPYPITPITVVCYSDIPDPDPIFVGAISATNDNCTSDLTVNFVSDVSDGNSGPEVISRTYSFTDDSGNSVSVVQLITINDNENPTASNLPAIEVVCHSEIPAYDTSIITDATDNCTNNPTIAFVSDVSDGNTQPETITRTYSVSDDSGNSISVTQTITVNDATNPTASNLTSINVQCISEVPTADITILTVADNCTSNPAIIFVSDVSDENFNPEIITRTYSVSDESGNSISVTQTITIEDTTNPTASSLPSLSLQCVSEVPTADISILTVADNCTNPTITFVSDVSDGNFNPETITRTYSVSDESGNTISVIQTITIEDTTNPTASSLPSINVQCIGDVPTADTSILTVSDNCTNPIIAFVSDVSDGNYNPEIITRTYAVSDDSGNSISVTQTITVTDTINPTASNLPDVAVVCSSEVPAYDISIITDVTDNCTSNPTITFISDVSDGNTNPETITRTYAVSDESRNIISVIQIITVNDTVNPTADNLPSINVQCIGEVPASDISILTVADNCTINPEVNFVSDVSDGNFNPEIITRTYSVSDESGNTISVTQTITVEDTTNPTADNLLSVNVQCIDDVPTSDISILNVSDNCTSNPEVNFISDVSDGNYNPEIITRTYAVLDESGNEISITQTITIEDTTDPTANNLSPINVQCISEVPTADVSLLTTVSDNCTSNPEVNFISDVSDGNFNPETITRTYSVSDESGNTISVIQTITVEDVTNPTSSNLPSLNLECISEMPTSDISLLTVADNCTSNPEVSFVSDVSDGHLNPETITRTYAVSDESGNEIFITQSILIIDNENPISKCKELEIRLDKYGQATITRSDVNNASTDNCGIETMTVTPNTFTSDNLGENFVNLTVTDFNGNTDTCVAIVTVKVNLNGGNFVYYPNPTNGELKIESKYPVAQIRVFSNLGVLLLENKGENKIDISHLSGGFYVIMTKDIKGNIGNKKVLKK